MLDIEALQVVFDPFGNEVHAIIRDESIRNPVPSYNVVSDELFSNRGGNGFVGGCFHPLSKIVDRYQNVAVTVGSWWVYGADDIDPLGGERPRRRHAM